MRFKKNICEDCCKGKRISELDEKVDIQGTEYIPFLEGDDNGKFSLGSLKDYLFKLIEEYLINNGIIREDWVQSEPAYKLLATLPELIADRACKDEFGNNINDTYLTREAVKEYIGSIYKDLFVNNPPQILDGFITVDMLSDAVLQLLNSGGAITNFPDDEDITVKDGKLKFKDKVYDPNNYSGMGRTILRKNMVDGVNVLTQEMMSEPNVIYVIQYDYDLRGETIVVPDNSILWYLGGSLNNGHITSDDEDRLIIWGNLNGDIEIDIDVSLVGAPADEEDITTESGVLKFKDKEYDTASFSGLGRKYLRKNIVNGKNILTQEMINSANTRYIIQYDYDLNEETITIPEGCTLDFQGGSLNNGTINFPKGTYIRNLYKGTATITGNPTYIDYLADEEDVTTENGILKFKDKKYSSSNFSGLGRKYLRKNIVDGKNILTQDMINSSDTIYIIQYDYDLNEETITVPEGCVLKFEGGSLSNGTIIGDYTYIETEKPCFDINLGGTFAGDINADWFYLEYESEVDQSELIEFIIKQAQFSTTKTIRFGKGTLWIDATRNVDPEYYYTEHGCIEVPSNVNINLEGTTLKVIPNARGAYNALSLINVENVVIDGGTFIGDAQEHQYSSSGTHEWGYGIAIFGSRNITVKNCVCNYFTGDGINIQVTESIPIGDSYDNHCKNIIIDGVKCWYNRRQGISIEACIECKVNNCDIQYTGSINGTAPMAGIDIEPKSMTNIVKDCTISNSTLINNKGHNIMSKIVNEEDSNINIENLYIVGCDVSREGNSRSLGLSGKNIQVSSCKIGKFEIYKGINVNVTDSTLEDIIVNHWMSSLDVNSCSINVKQYLVTIWINTIQRLIISDCTINLNEGSSLYNVQRYNNNISSVKLIDNYIISASGETTINAQTTQLINNKFKDSEARILTPIKPAIVDNHYYINPGTIEASKSVLLKITKQSSFNRYIPISIGNNGEYTDKNQTTPVKYNLILGNNYIKMNGCSYPILVEDDYTMPCFCVGNLRIENTLVGCIEIYNPENVAWTPNLYIDVENIKSIQFSIIDKSEDITFSIPMDIYRTRTVEEQTNDLGPLFEIVEGSIMKDLPMDVLKYKMSKSWRNSDGTLVSKVIII